MTPEHVDDLAELYALGALDDSQRAGVEAHLRTCPACVRSIAAAEHAVALVASMEPRRIAPRDLQARIERELRPPRRGWAFPAALAAAMVVAFLPSLYFWSQSRALHGVMQDQRAAIERLAAAPHRMARFHTSPGMPPAEVAYAPDGSWYLVVVHGIAKPLGVAWMHGGKRTMLGNAVPNGTIASLYLAKSHRMDSLALMDGDRIVAVARLSWQKTSPSRQADRSA